MQKQEHSSVGDGKPPAAPKPIKEGRGPWFVLAAAATVAGITLLGLAQAEQSAFGCFVVCCCGFEINMDTHPFQSTLDDPQAGCTPGWTAGTTPTRSLFLWDRMGERRCVFYHYVCVRVWCSLAFDRYVLRASTPPPSYPSHIHLNPLATGELFGQATAHHNHPNPLYILPTPVPLRPSLTRRTSR